MRKLIAASATSVRQFAREIDIGDPRVHSWLTGDSMPSAEHLIAIGKKPDVNVSLDWLLLGHGGHDVVYRDLQRSHSALTSELAELVSRAIPQVRPDVGAISGDACLRVLADLAQLEMAQWSEWLGALDDAILSRAIYLRAQLASLEDASGRTRRIHEGVGRLVAYAARELTKQQFGTEKSAPPSAPRTSIFRIPRLSLPYPGTQIEINLSGNHATQIEFAWPLKRRDLALVREWVVQAVGVHLNRFAVSEEVWKTIARSAHDSLGGRPTPTRSRGGRA